MRPGQKHGRRAINARWKGHVPNGKLAELRAASGAVMARHRRPPVSVMPPPELFVYNPCGLGVVRSVVCGSQGLGEDSSGFAARQHAGCFAW